jgi:ATP-dependent Clp protease ATP-binding subunit ClpB
LMAAGANQFVFNCTSGVKSHLLQEGTDPKYGARHLKRAIEKNLVFPLANLVATGQVKLGDFIRIDLMDGRMTFVKEAEGAMVPVLMERYGSAAGAAPAAARAARATVNRREFGATPGPENK